MTSRPRCTARLVDAMLLLAPALALACQSPDGLARIVRGAGGASSAVAEAASDRRSGNPWFEQGRTAVARAREQLGELASRRPARNVILFIGDGMGVATVTAARILEGQQRGESGEENRLAFEELPFLALSKTYSTDAQVSDSASTMTAMVSGVKTQTGVLGVDETIRRGDHRSVRGARVRTILEEAEARGLATGVVSTATVTHATPAGCYAHSPFRFWEDDATMSEAARADGFPDIARQLVEFPGDGDLPSDGLEVALGGGRQHFHARGTADPEDAKTPGRRLDGRDLASEWQQSGPGAVYVWNEAQLDALDLASTRRLLGLFEPGNMHFEADRGQDEAGEPSLAKMTGVAIELLSRDDDGFFLMVEAGRIDHAHHVGNAHRALVDTVALSDAVRVALEKTSAEDTLIVVTADHSHTLTISGYPKRGNPILGTVVAGDWFGGGGESVASDGLGLPYTTLSYANGPGYSGASAAQPEGVHRHPHRPCDRRTRECSFEPIRKGRPALGEVDTGDRDFLQEATVPLASETHAGEDVPIYAGGPRAALFHGVREQSYVYHAMVEALGWTEHGEPVR